MKSPKSKKNIHHESSNKPSNINLSLQANDHKKDAKQTQSELLKQLMQQAKIAMQKTDYSLQQVIDQLIPLQAHIENMDTELNNLLHQAEKNADQAIETALKDIDSAENFDKLVDVAHIDLNKDSNQS